MPRSQAEVRLAHAVLEGKAKNAGMDRDYASEVVGKMHGRKMASLPEHQPSKSSHAAGGPLGAGARNALPKSSFGLPAERKYPMPDKSHAANAKARASQQVKKGNLTPAQKARIDAKADRKLGGAPQSSFAAGGVLETTPGQKEKVRPVNLGAASAANGPRLPAPVPRQPGDPAAQGKDNFGRKFQPVSKHPSVPKIANRRYLIPVAVLLVGLLSSLTVSAQQGTPVNVLKYPYSTNPAELFFYDGSNNVTYICRARPDQPTATFSVAASTLTSVAVDGSNNGTITFPAPHGLQPGNGVQISGSATANLNGFYAVVSVPSTTTFTITTVSVGAGTYTDVTLQTSAPRSSAPIWSIEHFVYSGSNVSVHQWARGVAGNYTNICDNRAVVNGSSAISYK